MKKRGVSILSKIEELIFGKLVRIKDGFFGEMIDTGEYYECKRIFQPTAKVVEIGLEKKRSGTDEKQENFFNWIENNYDLIIKKVSPSIEKQIQNWILNYEIKNFREEYTLEYLYIPKCDEKIIDWKISFYGEKELKHWCSLDMRGLEVRGILIEG